MNEEMNEIEYTPQIGGYSEGGTERQAFEWQVISVPFLGGDDRRVGNEGLERAAWAEKP